MTTRKNSQKLLLSAFALLLVSGLGMSQAFAQSTPQVTFNINFEDGVYSIVAGAHASIASLYVEDGYSFQTPVAVGQHFDSAAPSAVASPYLSFHEEGTNTADNVIMTALGGAPFNLDKFDIINPGADGICTNPELRLSASDGSFVIIPGGSSGTFVVGFNNVLSVTFDIIDPNAEAFDLYCIDNFMFDDEPVGGEFLPIDSTALILAGAQTNAVWIMSALAVIGSVAFGALYITSKKN